MSNGYRYPTARTAAAAESGHGMPVPGRRGRKSPARRDGSTGYDGSPRYGVAPEASRRYGVTPDGTSRYEGAGIWGASGGGPAYGAPAGYGPIPGEAPAYTAPGYGAPESGRSLPTSVRLIVIIHYLVGLGLLFVAWLLVDGSVTPGGPLPMEAAVWDAIPGGLIGPDDRSLVLGGATAAGGLLAIAIGRKLRRGRQWVRIPLLVLSGFNLAGTLYFGVVVGKQTNALIGVVAPVLCLVLLNTPAARSWFRRGY